MYRHDQGNYARQHGNESNQITPRHIHKHHPFPQDSERVAAALPAALVSIL